MKKLFSFKPFNFEEEFGKLVKKYNLEGKIDLKMSTRRGYILTPITQKDGQIAEIPGEFMKRLLFLIFRTKKLWKVNWSCLKIGQPKTLSDIQNEIEAQQLSNELAWQICG